MGKTNLVKKEKNGRQVFYLANQEHPLFPELRAMVGKVMGIDRVVEGIIRRLGNLERAYLIGDYADGKDTGIIDLLLVGNINHHHLNDVCRKTERYIKRKIRALVFNPNEISEFRSELEKRPNTLIWTADTK